MPFHCGGRHLQLFNNNIEPSKGLIGLLLAASGRGGEMGGGGGDVGVGKIYDTGLEWRGERLWHRGNRAVRLRERSRRKTVCDDGEASGEPRHNRHEI